MVWRIEDQQGNEAGKIKYEIVQYTRGRGLDLGCGPSKAFPHFIGVDNLADTALFGVQMKPDIVVEDCSDLSIFGTKSMDFVFSSHLLEHIEYKDVPATLEEWWRVLKVGGYLLLYLPDETAYPKIGERGANPDHKWDVNYDKVVKGMDKRLWGWDLIRFEQRNQDNEYSLFFVFQKTAHKNLFSWKSPKPDKTACVVRYGGFGDMLQSCALFPELKRQGYHITVMTTPKGQNIIRHDPHIDDWFIQGPDQVPNNELTAYWEVQAKHFDKFINLSESVEGTLLAMPGRANHQWPANMRRKYLGKNYLEHTFELAELPFKPEPRFYPTPEENVEADIFIAQQIAKANVSPTAYKILWTLAGSSLHKFYPHQDTVIARILLDIPDSIIIFTGDMACKLLEQGWEDEPRVIMTSGELTIRQTLTLAQHVDCVVGPETGVLNAVGFDEKVAKICFLSHSSKENLTRDWVRTETLEPIGQHCWPCHRLHYGTKFCDVDEQTGAAMCQINISPDRVFDAVRNHCDSRNPT